jgi:hypothetical protein
MSTSSVPLAGTATLAETVASYTRCGVQADAAHPETVPEYVALESAAARLVRAWRHYTEGDTAHPDTIGDATEHLLSVAAEVEQRGLVAA